MKTLEEAMELLFVEQGNRGPVHQMFLRHQDLLPELITAPRTAHLVGTFIRRRFPGFAALPAENQEQVCSSLVDLLFTGIVIGIEMEKQETLPGQAKADPVEP